MAVAVAVSGARRRLLGVEWWEKRNGTLGGKKCGARMR